MRETIRIGHWSSGGFVRLPQLVYKGKGNACEIQVFQKEVYKIEKLI
jgi:hypothetical protein